MKRGILCERSYIIHVTLSIDTCPALACQPFNLLDTKKHPCVQGEYARGMSVLDWGGVLNRPANVQVVQRLNCDQLLDLLDQAMNE